ncbi:hypothetical protein [Pseudomonas sp. GZD-222]|uniref:hypothetical protein n=1 Tax=Pseudomonas sp. GZD-222 TaxID=3404805 RepID=UPI003BB77F36
MFGFLRDRRELWLFIGAWIAFVLLLAVKIKFDVPDGMKAWPSLIAALQSDAFEDISGDLLIGLISAYFFYLVIELFPRRRTEQKTKGILSTLLSSLVETFLHDRITAHAEPLGKFHELRTEEIDASKLLLKNKPDLRQFLSLTFIAKWGYPKFSNSLQLAVSLGVDHARVWMDLTDCVARIKEHGERADRTELLGQLVDIINLVGKPEIDDSVEDDAFMWVCMMRDDMKKFLALAEEWQALCR